MTPKILLIDCDPSVREKIEQRRREVLTASFGCPYLVDNRFKHSNIFIFDNSSFPNTFEEQEIIIIDLQTPNRRNLPEPLQDKEPSSNLGYKGTPIIGEINPRPALMHQNQSSFDRILNHGGNFIIFSEPKKISDFNFWSRSDKASQRLHISNWSFLSTTDNYLNFEERSGMEATIESEDPLLISFLKKYTHDIEYRCVISTNPRLKSFPLLKNKFRELIACEIQLKKGKIFIFPHFTNKADFLEEFIFHVLPNLSPHLFPSDKSLWIHEKEYELPRILEIKKEIEEIQAESHLRILEKEKEINLEKETNGFLQDLIIETGDQLVNSVQRVLLSIGFKDVVDMDKEEKDKPDKSLREDLQIRDNSPLLLIEIKGISNLPKDEDSLQVTKYLFPRSKELKRLDLQGLLIVNQQRNLAPLQREQKNIFRQDILTNAEEQGFGLMTTWDLFKLTRSFVKNQWNHEQIKDIFYQKGRIQIIPKHYKYIGKIEKIWEQANSFGFQVINREIHKSNKIALELNNEFEEQTIESLKTNNMDVEKVEVGQPAGIKTHLGKERLSKNVNIFLVSE